MRSGADIESGFRLVDERLHPILLEFFEARGSLPAEAENLAQRTLTEVFLGVRGLEKAEGFFSWLFPIVSGLRGGSRRGDEACPSELRGLAFHAGTLPEGEREAVREHLAACAGCRDVAGDAREFLDRMGGLAAGGRARPRPREFTRRRMLALGATVLFVAGSVVYMTLDRGGASTERTLEEARRRMHAKDWRGAAELLDPFLLRHPGHPEAVKLREEVRRAPGG